MAPEIEVAGAAATANSDAPTQAMVDRVFALATEVLGDEAKVLSWLRRPHRVLGAAPLMLIHSRRGLEAVQEELEGLSHGIV
jgi:uncharacterized protein (DUF2384 family)